MKSTSSIPSLGPQDLDVFLDNVVTVMTDHLGSTSLGFLFRENKGLLSTGKMLRSRMAARLGFAAGISEKTLLHAAAAVEMIHSASLLHDDVIDGGMIRRGAPSFWVERGVPGAILLGDMLLFKALDLICQVEEGRLTHCLVKMTGELCEAESEQELILQGAESKLEHCVRIARHKTGALFAFIGFACSGTDPKRQAAMIECGYLIGTAYQMADDVLDATGDAAVVGKTLGTDRSRNIVSAADLCGGDEVDPVQFIHGLCEQAEQQVIAWPEIQRAVTAYLNSDIRPALDKLLACVMR